MVGSPGAVRSTRRRLRARMSTNGPGRSSIGSSASNLNRAFERLEALVRSPAMSSSEPIQYAGEPNSPDRVDPFTGPLKRPDSKAETGETCCKCNTWRAWTT